METATNKGNTKKSETTRPVGKSTKKEGSKRSGRTKITPRSKTCQSWSAEKKTKWTRLVGADVTFALAFVLCQLGPRSGRNPQKRKKHGMWSKGATEKRKEE